MYLVRYLVAGVAAIFFSSLAAIRFYPNIDFVQYVPLALMAGTTAVIVLTAISLFYEGDMAENGKTYLMSGFLLVIMIPTIFTVTAFVHESETSWSGGEVHWHADFEVIIEGEEVDLMDPEAFCKELASESALMCSLNDRVGITEYHEHDDDRIHVEGVFKTYDEATLGAFFRTFDGDLTNTRIRIPTDDGWVDRENTGENTLKIVIQRGVGQREWCLIGDPADLGVSETDICLDKYRGDRATSPDQYVITDEERDQLSVQLLDKIYIIYDETAPADVLEDMRDDDEYTYNGETFGITKEGGAD